MNRVEIVEATRRALANAVAEHGAPNSFAPSELYAFNNAPPAALQGRFAASEIAGFTIGPDWYLVKYLDRRWCVDTLEETTSRWDDRVLLTYEEGGAVKATGADSGEALATLGRGDVLPTMAGGRYRRTTVFRGGGHHLWERVRPSAGVAS